VRGVEQVVKYSTQEALGLDAGHLLQELKQFILILF
jgi:hypothetical protein